MASLSDRYRIWFDYEQQMHQRVIDSLATVPAERRTDPAFRKAIDLFAHLMAARRLWLARIGYVADGPSTQAEIFPQEVALEALPDLATAMSRDWTGYLATLGEAEIDRGLEYTSTEGVRYRDRVENVLTQLFGHSLYHRGQIALLVRSLGGTPAETDFVFWSRETLPD